MVGKIILTVTSFVLFIYILLFKMIKKNDTTYLVILVSQAIGILINLLQITLNILQATPFDILIYLLCIIIPVLVSLLELKKINVSEIINLSMAQIYIWAKNDKKSKEFLVNTLTKYRDSYRGHKMLAQIYEHEGGMRKAIDEYVKVIEINNKDYKSYYKISILLKDLGKKDETIEMLNNLLSVKPDIYEAVKMLGDLYLEKEEYKKVIKVYTKALKYNKENYEIYYNLAIAYSMINDFETARKCYEKTVELNDEYYRAYYKLGQIALLYRDFDTAEQNFSKSIYNEKEAKSYIELAKINIIKNRKEKAIVYLNNAIKIDTNYYDIIKKEPMFFAIKNSLEKPEKETKSEYKEDELEEKIENYLSNTYELVQVLNKNKGKDKSNKKNVNT